MVDGWIMGGCMMDGWIDGSMDTYEAKINKAHMDTSKVMGSRST